MKNSESTSEKLGELLIRQGLITRRTLETALDTQRGSGGRIGEILSHQGHIAPLPLHQSVAHQHDLPFVNLRDMPPCRALLRRERIEDYLRGGLIPWRLEEDGTLIIAVCTPGQEAQHHARALFPNARLDFAVTSPRDIIYATEQAYGAALVEEASERLALTHPHYALRCAPAKRLGSLALSVLVLAGMAAGAYYYPQVSAGLAVGIACLFFASTLAFKVLLVCIGLARRSAVFALSDMALLEDAALPVYTVLVPLLDEAESVPSLLDSMRALDYPAHKLDIKLIVETGDSATLDALRAERPDARFQIVVVPRSAPQTKPKACNYALRYAKGEYIAIYDAEDTPARGQLRRAASVFAAYPGISCLQARLNYYNHDETWLTRLFCIEYTMLFEAMLPALYALGIPIPLGGTSNHIRRSALEEIGGWDAYNVTEDADLGVRLAAEGHVTLPIDCETEEEAPLTLYDWIRQRSRWIKGYLQTWAVLSRSHMLHYRRMGSVGFWGVHYFIGGSSLVYIISPLLWMAAMLGAAPLPGDASLALWLPDWALAACYGLLGVGFVVQSGCAMAVMRATTSKRQVGFWPVLCYPLYFTLHALAGLRAVWQLIWRPYHWDKTRHGLTSVARSARTGGLTDAAPAAR